MKFKYKKVAPKVLRPIIPIEIGNDFFVSYEVLVDSGADMCLFDSSIADLLEIDVRKGEKLEVSGITGDKQTYFYHRSIPIKVGGWEYKINAGFMEGTPYGYGVVGQESFIEIFIVKFDLIKEEIELVERKKK